MSPVLTILLALLSRVNPADVASIVKELVDFVDPLIAKRGFLIRSAWGVLKGFLLSANVTEDIKHLLNDVKAHPEVAAAASQWAV